MDRRHRGIRVTFAGLIANTVLAAGKFTAGLAGHSHALVADAVESLADIVSSIIVWRGIVLAAEPADEDHPYGHGKAEPLAAATVAGMLILAAMWIVLQAAHAISVPHTAPAPFTLLVLLVVVVIKEGLFRFASHEADSIESPAVRSDAWHHRSDVISSLAAAVGISVSLVGGRGCESADDIAAMVAAGLIAWNGLSLLRPAYNELMDRSPGRAMVERIKRIAERTEGVDAVEKCLVRKMGYQYYVDMHVEVDAEMTVRQSHLIAHNVKDKVRAEIPAVSDVLVHIEPRGLKKARLRAAEPRNSNSKIPGMESDSGGAK